MCGLQFSTLIDLRKHREDCAWVCPVEGCGRKAKKEREIVQHKAKHSALDAKRAAALDLMAGLIP